MQICAQACVSVWLVKCPCKELKLKRLMITHYRQLCKFPFTFWWNAMFVNYDACLIWIELQNPSYEINMGNKFSAQIDWNEGLDDTENLSQYKIEFERH